MRICGATTSVGKSCRNKTTGYRCGVHNKTPRSRQVPRTRQRQVNYRKYLASTVWKARRAAWMAANNCDCYACGKGYRKGFHLHHVTYVRLGRELDRDMVMVCKTCHETIHEVYEAIKPLAAATDWVRNKNGLPTPSLKALLIKGRLKR